MNEWTECKEPKNAGGWQTPPNCQGQIVLVSYAVGGEDEDDTIYRRVWDQSDGTREYAKRRLAGGETFEPWQTEPE